MLRSPFSAKTKLAFYWKANIMITRTRSLSSKTDVCLPFFSAKTFIKL
jgi:hypothetical protein